MSDWYVSSVAYAAIAQWTASHAYVVGDIVRPLTTPALGREFAFRCTTAGTSSATEPTWTTANADGATRTDGGVTWTNVSGRSAYGWSAAAGTVGCFSAGAPGVSPGRPMIGDRVFVSSDHSETLTGNPTFTFNSNQFGWGLIVLISVNRAGSVPPVVADILPGASVTHTSSGNFFVLDAVCDMHYEGFTFTVNGSSNSPIYFASGGTKIQYFKNCTFVLTGTGTPRLSNVNAARVIFDNTKVQQSSAATFIFSSSGPLDLDWRNTPSAIGGSTTLTYLLQPGSTGMNLFAARGVDFSAMASAATLILGSPVSGTRALFDSCKIPAGITRFNLSSTAGEDVELINCFDGTNIINERYNLAGALAADRTGYLTDGAQDDVGHFSFKMCTNSGSDPRTLALDGFIIDADNALTGSSHTATVEIAAPSSLNDDDISLLVEYMGTAGSSIASFVSSAPASITAGSPLPSSSAVWTLPTYSSWSLGDAVGVGRSADNLTATILSSSGLIRAINGASTGKFYFELQPTTWASSNYAVIGLALNTVVAGGSQETGTGTAIIFKTGQIFVNGASVGSIASLSAGNIIGIAVDLTARLIWFRLTPSGNWNGSGTANPATGTGGFSLTGAVAAGTVLYPYAAQPFNFGDVVVANFGASSFSGAVPSGFTAGWTITPVIQKLQTSFTPQRAGWVRGLVRLGKPGMTAWVNPQLNI